jgi:hypothetical protein
MSAIVEPGLPPVAARSAVSWGAVFAGAAAAAALSLILLLLGTGLGLSSVSPWASEGIDASTFGVSSILWITFMQLAASAVGGYLAGRLRTKWAGVQTDEVYFRDTAHGLLAWAVATLDYVAQVVAQRTDLSQQQAEQRVREVFGNLQSSLNEAEVAAREAADAAREASAYAALWLFISLLAGAFVASWMATFGGRQRDL